MDYIGSGARTGFIKISYSQSGLASWQILLFRLVELNDSAIDAHARVFSTFTSSSWKRRI
jgi:hypothetical protein